MSTWIGADLMTFRWQKNGMEPLVFCTAHHIFLRIEKLEQIRSSIFPSINSIIHQNLKALGFGCAFWWNKPRGRSFTHVLPSPCDHSADIATDSNRPESAMKLSVLGQRGDPIYTWPHMCQGRSAPYIGGMVIPPLIGNPYHQHINSDQWGYDYSFP